MSCKDKEIATLVTSDLDLADVVIREYPGEIRGKQVEKWKIRDITIYLFKDLNLEKLKIFLRLYKSDEHMIVR